MPKFRHHFSFTDNSKIAIDADLLEDRGWLFLLNMAENSTERVTVGMVNASLVRCVTISPVESEPPADAAEG